MAIMLAACGSDGDKPDEIPVYNGLVGQVAGKRIGRDADHWIEMKNFAGEWERVGLIFGFIGDYEECLKVTAGMKKVNYAREYRFVPAN